MSIEFQHYNSTWEVQLDKHFEFKKVFLNGRNVTRRIKGLLGWILWEHINKNYDLQETEYSHKYPEHYL